jgi:NhaP-type Na+/H+ or K+/H+ antiporter
MIEGESLLNDGVAILLYEIFKEVVEKPDDESDQTIHITKQFLQIAVGGPTFGWVMGKLTIFCLSLIFNDAATEITITLVAAYLTYFIGEFYISELRRR